jgi:hypothetical protein
MKPNKYENWHRVFPHHITGRLIETQGWPFGFFILGDKNYTYPYILSWRDMDNEIAYYQLDCFVSEVET